MLKKHALGVALYEDGSGSQSGYESAIPFIHTEQDEQLERVYELKYLQKMTFVDIFGDIEGLDLDLTKEDFVEDE